MERSDPPAPGPKLRICAALGIDARPPDPGLAPWLRRAMRVQIEGRPNPRGGAPDYLHIRPVGRFGNNYIQLVQAVAVARAIGAGRVVHPFDLFQRPPGWWDPHLVAGAPPGETAWGIRTSFFVPSRIAALARLTPRQFARASDRFVRPAFVLPLPRRGPARIVVHLRGGDMFADPRPHPGYVPPPLAYFQAAILASPPAPIRLVFEDRGNPMVDALANWAQVHGLPLTLQSASLAEDAAAILAADTLILGCSSFSAALAMLSRRLRTLHLFRDTPCLRPLVAKHRVTWLWQDAGDFIPRGKWHNTPAQRAQLLAYPADRLTARRPGRRAAADLPSDLAGR